MAARRALWFEGRVCAVCGSRRRLELDHIDPAQKVSHAVWSWSTERREAELAKCQALCHVCHRAKSSVELIAKRLAKTHCKRGHPFEGENLQRDRRGNRVCRTCRRARR